MTYTRAIVPAVGDPVTSRVVISAARATNDRMKLGPAWPWRLVFYLLGAFRQIRNPDASRYLTPPQDEFFQFYQMLSPYDAQWPVAGPGEPEGIDINSQMGAFVFGVNAIGFPAEDERLTEGAFSIEAPNQKPATLWNLAKTQRGAIDPRTGAMGAPAFEAANSHAYLRQSPASPYGNAFGDWLPGPETTGRCAPPNDDRPSQTLLFTKLDGSGDTLTFGTCPESDNGAIGVANTPFIYAIFKWDGTVVVLPKTQWIEGPYTGNPRLRKTANGFIERAFNGFISEFRGDAQQRADGIWNEHAFDFQAVLTTQYHLAPQKGSETGDGKTVVAKYPLFRVRPPVGRVAAGSPMPLALGGVGSSYLVSPGFVCASALVQATGLTTAVQVSIARDGVELATVELTPEAADDDGISAAIVTFDRPEAGGRITATVVEGGTFAGETRELSVELSELLAYKPSLPDFMLILRMGGMSFDTDLDGSGTDCSFATTISEKYLTQGVITSIENHVALPGSLGAINSNAVFDAARRLSQCVRMMPRDNFTGIAVTGGKTVLWFKRWARGLRLDTPIDLFGGLAPAPDPIASGKLVWGKRYKVATAPVRYNNRTYGLGKIFTAAEDVLEFSPQTGGQVFEADGVYDALPGGWSNQWLMGLSLKPYNPAEASQWKPAAFGDQIPLLNRCLFGDPAIGKDASGVLLHVAYGQTTVDGVIEPEAHDGLNYVPTFGDEGSDRANKDLCTEGDTDCADRRKQFYQSCGIFEPWPQPLSVELDGDEIKVTFDTFHHDGDVDTADLARDPGTWDVTALRAEPRRTWRNALREYLLWANTGRNASVKIGDEALNSTLQTNPDAAYGAVLPTFLWTQLVREPFEDGNEDQDLSDSPLVHDEYARMDLYIRAGCEGFVNGPITAKFACQNATTDLFGYTWEDLLLEVTGGRGFPILPKRATDLIGPEDTRPDQPDFHGPLPNVLVSAETAGYFAEALNRLTTFRVIAPFTLQCRVGTAVGDVFTRDAKNPQGQVVADGNPGNFGAGDFAVYVQGGPAGVGSLDYSGSPGHDWEDTDIGYSAILQAKWLIAFQDSPTGAHNLSQQQQAEFRWVGIGDAIYAIPPAMRDLLTTSPTVFALVHMENTNLTKTVVVGDHNGTQSHTVGHSDDDTWSTGDPGGAGHAILFVTSHSGLSETCQQLKGGTFATGPAPAGVAWDSDDAYGTGTIHRDGPQRNVTVTLLNATTPAITVPLADLPVAPPLP